MNEIKLKSPYNDEEAIFSISPGYKIENLHEIPQIIRFLSDDYSDIKPYVNEYYNKSKKSFEHLQELVNSYNEWVETLNKTNVLEPCQATFHLIKFLMQLIYNRAVVDPGKLNHYEAFSPEVYGETSFDLIDKVLQRIPLNENDTFLDLGSGVGNVVLHVAAANKCKLCVGVEKAEWPATYAQNMEKEFRFWMQFFGKTYSDFRLHKGDFFADDEFVELDESPKSEEESLERKSMNNYVKEIINDSRLIFVNNYAFGAGVDHQLKMRFLDMLEGSFIVSSKPFCPLNFRLNDRNLNDIGAILNTTDFEPLSGSVSWTPNPVTYYFQKIDRTLLERYFFECRKGCTGGAAAAHSSSKSSSLSSSPGSSSSPKRKNDDDDHDETTTTAEKKSKKQRKDLKNEISENGRNKEKQKSKQSKIDKSLDKQEKKTLDEMHKVAVVVASSTNSSSSSSSSSNSSFNQRSLTKLVSENLDSKSLKESKISPKLYKHVSNGKGVDVDEMIARRELGDDVMNSIDSYLKKCRKQYIKYLLYLKSPEYREKIKQQYQKERNFKIETLSKIELLESQNKELIKKNVSLLKTRAIEIGIKDLNSPFELIQYAKDILSERKELEQKLAKLSNKSNHVLTNKSNSKEEASQKSIKLLGKMVKTIDPSNSNSVESMSNCSEDTQSATEQDDDLLVDEKPKHSNNKNKSILDQVYSKDATKSLKTFKIPKQVANEIKPEITNISMSTLSSSNNNLANNKSSYSSNYYHPKKNQFRQYMMENPNSSSPPLSRNSLTSNWKLCIFGYEQKKIE